MNKFAFAAAALWAAATAVSARIVADRDSLRVIDLQEVQVVSTRATAKTPVAFTNVDKGELKKVNFGQDIPYLLGMTPSTLTTSDAGAGIGYTSLRVRGTDGTRINITVNGVPMNDAESHTLFWVNMPDFASSVKDIQVQRGAGTSTNGAGAFGASVNMQTESASTAPYAEVNTAFGSFGTHKATVKFGTGLLANHWTFDARLSNIGTNGYIDRASVDLNSYFLQAGYFAGSSSLKFIAFAGKEKTYHAWKYATKEQMQEHGRRYNPSGEFVDSDGKLRYYDDQTDNYLQKNYQLLFNHRFSAAWNLDAALHYTKGDGYYEEYKSDAYFAPYRLSPFTTDGTERSQSDLVRRKMMDNDFGGGIFSLNYAGPRLQASLGGGLNQYRGKHFGRVIWVKEYMGSLLPDHEYYRNSSRKTDGNLYLKAQYDLTPTLGAYADMQYRHIAYTIDGVNDKYDWNRNVPQPLAVDQKFDFFNPKAGLNWNIDAHQRLYASVSVAHKEPTRNNYTDAKQSAAPRAEKLTDYEAGYSYTHTWFTAGANFYYMDYTDQLVLTGALNEIGEPLTENMPDSYRMGMELMLGIKPIEWFRWDVNATWSRNRIKNFTETLQGYHYDAAGNATSLAPEEINHGDTPIAFSPDFLLNNRFVFLYKGFEAALQSQYVSKQYMTNARIEELTLESYFVSNLHLSYTFRPSKTAKEVSLGLTLYNLFNERYENNGWADSSYTDTPTNRSNYAGYAAQAGTHAMAHLSLRF